jgi:hypothetical protein
MNLGDRVHVFRGNLVGLTAVLESFTKNGRAVLDVEGRVKVLISIQSIELDGPRLKQLADRCLTGHQAATLRPVRGHAPQKPPSACAPAQNRRCRARQ